MTTEPCPTCGAAMAGDQRYCLACGNRRAGARLDFLEILRGEPVAAAGPAPAAARVEPRHRANTTIIASVGCLLLAMGIGVLIGNSGNDTKTAAPVAAPAQVIKVQGGGTAAAASAAPAAKKAAKKTKAAKQSAAKDTESAPTAAQSKATNPTLQQLDNTSGSDYAKQSQKLPKTVSTGGKPPPIDKSKPVGGGSDVQDIG